MSLLFMQHYLRILSDLSENTPEFQSRPGSLPAVLAAAYVSRHCSVFV